MPRARIPRLLPAGIVFFLLSLPCAYGTVRGKDVALIASGETHAMINTCDCPQEPGGGLAKRSSIVSDLRKNHETLLIDAGGFAAGGIYDRYTEGREGDSIRTAITMQAMAYMKYDAVAVGDEELQYPVAWVRAYAQRTGVPLLCANCFDGSGISVFPLYRIVTKGSIRFGITAVTTQERVLTLDTAAVIQDPVHSIRAFWDRMKSESDIQVIISHCGQEQTRMLADSFPECAIVLNGHRKQSLAPVEELGQGRYMMQFGFEGKTLSLLFLKPESKTFFIPASGRREVSDSVDDDTTLAQYIKALHGSAAWKKKQVYDLYMMGLCPYGLAALKESLVLQDQTAGFVLNVWFIGDVEPDGSLRSLHGKEEVDEEKLWLAVRSCYPDLWTMFLRLMVLKERTAREAATDLGLDTVKLHRWVERNGTGELGGHYVRSARLRIAASPTLLINNTPYPTEITYGRLQAALCAQGAVRYSFCDSIPGCFDDEDCIREKKIGVCKREGNGASRAACVYSDDAAFDCVILVPDSAHTHPEISMAEKIRQLFPAVNIRRVNVSGREGVSILKRFKPGALPFFIFTSNIAKARRFASFSPGLKQKKGFFILKDDFMPGNYFLSRPFKRDDITLFVDPLFPDMRRLIETISEHKGAATGFTIVPTVANGGRLPDSVRQQAYAEALVIVYLQEHRKNVLMEYLKHCTGGRGKNTSLQCLSHLGVDSAALQSSDTKTRKVYDAMKRETAPLHSDAPVAVLINNKELMPVRNQSDLVELLRKTAGDGQATR